MSKELYIARHAKSSWDDATLKDIDRPLNERGKRDAPIMAEVLKKMGVTPELIVASPALRAKTTAKIYLEVLGGKLVEDRRIYEDSAITLLFVAQHYFDQADRVMIVGHNPSLSELATMLTGEHLFEIPTSAVVGVAFDEAAPQQSKLLFYEYPKKYRNKEA